MGDRLLCHFDGTSGSASFTDAAGHTLTASGVTVNTAAPKFGTGAGDFTSSSAANINCGVSIDFNFGPQFTVEAWVYFTSAPGTATVIMSRWGGSTNLGWLLYYTGTQISFAWSTTGSDTPLIATNFTPTLNTWYHIAADRDASNVIRLYVNGAVVGSTTSGAGFFASTRPLVIGNTDATQGNNAFPGRLDEARISNVAQYGGVFTPPSAPFTYVPIINNVQVTQASLEEWTATSAFIPFNVLATQVALEEWASVAVAVAPMVDLAGNLGSASHYGRFHYGLGHYSRGGPLAPVFSGSLTVVPAFNLVGGLTPTIVLAADLDVHVNLIELSGNLAPQIALGGSLSLLVPLNSLLGSFGFTVVYGAAEMISGPLWADSEPCPSPLWLETEPCPVPPWMAAPLCSPVTWSKSRLCNG